MRESVASVDRCRVGQVLPKILGDARVSFLSKANMPQLKKHARAFLTMAFGGPNHYEGRDLRAAHARARGQG